MTKETNEIENVNEKNISDVKKELRGKMLNRKNKRNIGDKKNYQNINEKSAKRTGKRRTEGKVI